MHAKDMQKHVPCKPCFEPRKRSGKCMGLEDFSLALISTTMLALHVADTMQSGKTQCSRTR